MVVVGVGGRGGNRVQLAGSVSLCHARGISPQITQRENYNDAFRCPLSRAAPRVFLRRRAGRQSGCDRLRLNAKGGAFSRTCRSLLDGGLISHFHALPSALPIKPSIHKKKRENTFANVTKKRAAMNDSNCQTKTIKKKNGAGGDQHHPEEFIKFELIVTISLNLAAAD